ncbi:predicted protein [Sclerotinia sclerotiorum 1980 UF-70]|uniref:Uncharacterized protein n=1 Tax=Sclerotinia sclerotiorum (strain ATCC 18683 / 1980 / Ss-1) TaxID=665079 RepID=A7ELR3_SCLS1|nr:predicted protein [Sclerotinia sclerotiorum 1980 UF-70]EDO03779.1 predicted protein [Sclerotinia sclerotiorum 1980 UF-70]
MRRGLAFTGNAHVKPHRSSVTLSPLSTERQIRKPVSQMCTLRGSPKIAERGGEDTECIDFSHSNAAYSQTSITHNVFRILCTMEPYLPVAFFNTKIQCLPRSMLISIYIITGKAFSRILQPLPSLSGRV